MVDGLTKAAVETVKGWQRDCPFVAVTPDSRDNLVRHIKKAIAMAEVGGRLLEAQERHQVNTLAIRQRVEQLKANLVGLTRVKIIPVPPTIHKA